MTLVKFNNGNKTTSSVLPALTDLFEPFFNDAFLSDKMVTRIPAVNISETHNDYLIELAAPGLKKDDFQLKLDRNMLMISVEQQNDRQNENGKFSKREFSYSSFVRSFALPDSADDSQIDAEYNDGILKIHIAKKEEAKSISRTINIK